MKQQHPVSLITASVCVGYAETRYTRGGTGDTVVVLAANSRSRATLTAALARWFRVIAPELQPPGVTDGDADRAFTEAGTEPADGSEVARLAGILDALGLDRVSLVADESFAASAIAFALLAPERAAAVVLTLSGASRPSPYPSPVPYEASIEGRLRTDGERNDLLAVWVDADATPERANAVADGVAEFLASR